MGSIGHTGNIEDIRYKIWCIISNISYYIYTVKKDSVFLSSKLSKLGQCLFCLLQLILFFGHWSCYHFLEKFIVIKYCDVVGYLLIPIAITLQTFIDINKSHNKTMCWILMGLANVFQDNVKKCFFLFSWWLQITIPFAFPEAPQEKVTMAIVDWWWMKLYQMWPWLATRGLLISGDIVIISAVLLPFYPLSSIICHLSSWHNHCQSHLQNQLFHQISNIKIIYTCKI